MNKVELKELINEDKKLYASKTLRNQIFNFFTCHPNNNFKKTIITSRKYNYYSQKEKKWKCIIKRLYYTRKLNKLAIKNNINIKGNFGKKLRIFHENITININAKLGDNVILHGNNCIGNNGKDILSCPVIGNNVEIGYGATIIGKIKIADNVIIGANALVNKDVLEEGCIVAGNPAKKIGKIS